MSNALVPRRSSRILQKSLNAALQTIPYGKQAVAAAKVIQGAWRGYKYVKKFANKRTQAPSVKKGSGKWSGRSTGIYKGKFKKLKKVKKNTPMMTAASKGYVKTAETYGRMEDSQAVYLTHSSYHYELIMTAILGAALRKLFIKAGVVINDANEELPLYDTINSDGFKVIMSRLNMVDGTTSQIEYITTNDITLSDIANNWTAGRNYIGDYMMSIVSAFPCQMLLYQSDRNGIDTNWRLASRIDLMNEKINIITSSHVLIQNRSAGDNAGVGEKYQLDRVDSQPVNVKFLNSILVIQDFERRLKMLLCQLTLIVAIFSIVFGEMELTELGLPS